MNASDLGLSHGAETALINSNTQSGRLPQGTPDMVHLELREAGLIGALGMTTKGRMYRRTLIDRALEAL